jgi:hypothetical protein
MTSSLAAKQAAFDKAAADLRAEIAKLQRFPEELPFRTVLAFQKVFGDKEREYVAIRLEHGWYVTGSTGARTWANLVDFIDDAPCAIATNWDGVPVAPVNPVPVLSETELAKILDKGRRGRTPTKELAARILDALNQGRHG